MRNEEMEMWAEKVRSHFPPPRYRVELKAFESELWVVDEQTHHIAEMGEEEFLLATEGQIYETLERELAN
jgi:hypothetical protein